MATITDEFIKKAWNCYKLENDFYIIKHYDDQDGFKILVSDGINLWFEYLNNSEIQSRHDSLNPTVESPIDQILTDIKNVVADFESKKNNSVTVIRTDEKLQLICESKTEDPAPFVWNFQLSQHDKTLFADHLTFPFISMMIEQEARIEELCKIIHQKDNEILDYKLSRATLSRARLETQQFEESSFFKRTYSAMDELSKSSPVQLLSCNDKLQTLYQMMTERVRLKMKTSTNSLEKSNDETLNSLMKSQITADSDRNQNPDLNDSREIEDQRRAALKKRLMEQEKSKEAKRKLKKLVKL